MSRRKHRFPRNTEPKLGELSFPAEVDDHDNEDFMGFSYVGENYHKQDTRATQDWMAALARTKEQVR